MALMQCKTEMLISSPKIHTLGCAVTHVKATKKSTRTKHVRRPQTTSRPNHKGTTLLHSTPASENQANARIPSNHSNPQKLRNILGTKQRLSAAKGSRGLGIRREFMGNRRLSSEKGLQPNLTRTESAELHGTFGWTHTHGYGNRRN